MSDTKCNGCKNDLPAQDEHTQHGGCMHNDPQCLECIANDQPWSTVTITEIRDTLEQRQALKTILQQLHTEMWSTREAKLYKKYESLYNKTPTVDKLCIVLVLKGWVQHIAQFAVGPFWTEKDASMFEKEHCKGCWTRILPITFTNTISSVIYYDTYDYSGIDGACTFIKTVSFEPFKDSTVCNLYGSNDVLPFEK